jgi:hypothetical protein
VYYPAVIHGPLPVLPSSELPILELGLKSSPKGTPCASSGFQLPMFFVRRFKATFSLTESDGVAEWVSHNTNCFGNAPDLSQTNMFFSPFADDHLPHEVSSLSCVGIGAKVHFTHFQGTKFLLCMNHTFGFHSIDRFKSILLILCEGALSFPIEIVGLPQKVVLSFI